MEILWIDACIRKSSRTRRLAETLLKTLPGSVTRLCLADMELPLLDEAAILQRAADGTAGDFSIPAYRFARQFAEADCILISAPYWDLSFPAVLKRYVEAVSVCGVTFRYSEEGIPIGLCRAKCLYYITTAGGPLTFPEFGYGYIRALSCGMFGIPECRCYYAENLDLWDADVEAILLEAEAKMLEEETKLQRCLESVCFT